MESTNNWTTTSDRPGYRTKTIKRGNITLVIHRPVLDDKERAKRESLVESALSTYARSLASNT